MSQGSPEGGILTVISSGRSTVIGLPVREGFWGMNAALRNGTHKHPYADVRVFVHGWDAGGGDLRVEGVSVPMPSDSLSP